MHRRVSLVVVVLACLVSVGAGLGGGFAWGRWEGLKEGIPIGESRGARRALARPPLTTIDRGHPDDVLAAHPAVQALGPLDDKTRALVLDGLRQAPSPCFRMARRGASVADTLVNPEATPCQNAASQVALAWAAARTYGTLDDVLAVLRVERRQPVQTSGELRGPADAPVTVVVWADFQCPYCRKIRPALDRLLERGDVNVAFQHLPLNFHPAALPAAYAAEAAGRQGRFWDMHDALFDLGRDIGEGIERGDPAVPDQGPVRFEALATSLGLDVERFRKDVRDPSLQQRVKDDLAQAKALGVTATPTVWINARRVIEPKSFENLNLLVDKAIAEAEGRFSWDLDEPPSKAAEAFAAPADPSDEG